MKASNSAERIITMECLAILALSNTPEEMMKPYLRDEEYAYFQELKTLSERSVRRLTPYHAGDFRLSEEYNRIYQVSALLSTYFENGLLIYYKWSEEDLDKYMKLSLKSTKL
jgi:hypothetical protein